VALRDGVYVQTSGLERTTGDAVRLRVGAGGHGLVGIVVG
jgi:hypothetical protein